MSALRAATDPIALQRYLIALAKYNEAHNFLLTASIPMTSTVSATTAATPIDMQDRLQGMRRRRLRFALLLKILFKHLEKSNDQFLLERARHIVKTAIQRSTFVSLDVELRECVGDSHWQRAQTLTTYFLRRRVPASEANIQAKTATKAKKTSTRPTNLAHSA